MKKKKKDGKQTLTLHIQICFLIKNNLAFKGIV